MKRVNVQKTQTEITLEKVNKAMKKVYFCPYCKIIFRYQKDYKRLKNNEFISTDCECTSFTRDTYKKYTNNKKPYNINTITDKYRINLHITKIVLNFKKDGLSNDNIHKITHFPFDIINNIVQESLPENYTMSLEDFLHTKLKLRNSVCDMIINEGKLQADDEENFIIQAIKYGCGRDFIRNILPVKTDKITRQNKIIKLSHDNELRDTIKYNKDRRTIKLLNDSVIIKYGKKK